MASRKRLTDEQWAVLAPLITPPARRADGRGRPIEHDDRAVMDGVLWILRTGAAWADLPDAYPSYATCFRRFSTWVKDGTLGRLLEALARTWKPEATSICRNALSTAPSWWQKKGA